MPRRSRSCSISSTTCRPRWSNAIRGHRAARRGVHRRAVIGGAGAGGRADQHPRIPSLTTSATRPTTSATPTTSETLASPPPRPAVRRPLTTPHLGIARFLLGGIVAGVCDHLTRSAGERRPRPPVRRRRPGAATPATSTAPVQQSTAAPASTTAEAPRAVSTTAEAPPAPQTTAEAPPAPSNHGECNRPTLTRPYAGSADRSRPEWATAGRPPRVDDDPVPAGLGAGPGRLNSRVPVPAGWSGLQRVPSR